MSLFHTAHGNRLIFAAVYFCFHPHPIAAISCRMSGLHPATPPIVITRVSSAITTGLSGLLPALPQAFIVTIYTLIKVCK